MRKRLRLLKMILHRTKADRVLGSYLFFVFGDAALIWLFEPTIHTYRDALWYCYAVLSTAGFGDMVATMPIPRLLSVLLTVYSLLALAIITGVVVNFYTEIIASKNRETMTAFLDRLEVLPDLSREELKQLSQQVTRHSQAKPIRLLSRRLTRLSLRVFFTRTTLQERRASLPQSSTLSRKSAFCA